MNRSRRGTGRCGAMLAFGLALTQAAWANDGYAGLGAGGLEFDKSETIEMAEEDLYLSRSAVRVDYVFRNTGENDEDAFVAFQLPPLAPIYAELDYAIPDEMRSAGQLNYMRFKAWVDGEPVELSHEVRYYRLCADCGESGWGLSFLERDDEELTQRLTALSVPESYDLAKIRDWFAGLPRAEQAKLKREGIFVDAEAGPAPMYWMSVRYYWQQIFPAGEEVSISHAYRPVLGASVPALDDEIVAAHCIDAGTMRAIRKAEGRIEGQTYLDYVLTTAGTWKGPIGEFRMTIDKEDANDIVSLCAEGVRKTGPTTFVVEKKAYRPREDIRIMFVDVR